MNFKPLHDYAMLVKVEPSNQVNGIYLPEDREKNLPMARIVELGPDFETTPATVTGQPYPSGLAVGDVVIYQQGQKIIPPGAKEYRLCRRNQIVAKVEGAEDLTETVQPLPAVATRPVGAMARAAGRLPQ